MKYRIAIIATLSLLALIPAGAEVVDIPDIELERVIRHHLDLPSGDILRADMERLITLDASLVARWSYASQLPALIRSLEGLDAATNLQVLILSGSHWGYRNVDIVDFSPLGALTHLEVLNLSYNLLSQVDLPDGLSSLVDLHLSHNALEEFRLPEGLNSLQRLYLGWNQLTGLELPANLTQLTRLDLYGMPDFDALSTLPDGWLDVPESMSDLWIRYGYSGQSYGCGGYSYRSDRAHYDYLGSYTPRIIKFGMAENGELALTVDGRLGDRIMVEVSVDQQNWQDSFDLAHSEEIHTLRMAGADAPPVAQYRLRLLRPYEGWPPIPIPDISGEE